MRNLCAGVVPLFVILLGVGCNNDNVSSDEDARRAYLGLDTSISKSINLGFQGFNMASSANIAPQTTMGDKAGTLTVGGQVDQGSSANKTMRLEIGMVGYDDGDIEINDKHDKIHVVYDTETDAANQPYLQMKLSNIPTGTLDGTITSNTSMKGVYHLSGDLKGTLALDVTFNGVLMACTAPCMVLRVPGSTHVTGTATNNSGGVYMIDLTI